MTMTTDGGPRVLFARRPGRTVGGLVFRVGYADETLPTSGTTALVVALAVRAVERPGLDVAASVGPAVTEVRVSGSDDRVRTTLRDLSRALADLPVRHRETEARSLRERAADVVALPPWRFGLQGYGLGPSEYVGLHRATGDGLRAWARERFVGSNAVAWFTGETTRGLDLELPDAGPAVPAFPAPPVQGPALTLPADAPAGGTNVMWGALVPDVPALGVLAEVARRALFQSLRHDRGWTYDVSTSIGVLDGQQAALQIAAGLRPETAAEATGEFLDTWGRLRHAVAADELEAARAHLMVAFDEPHQDAMWLADDAVETLLGRPVRSPAERRSALADVTAADVVSLARQAWDSGLLVAPVGSGWAGTSLVPRGAGDPVVGRAFERVDVDATIVVGDAGATLRDGRTRTTVRFGETAALLAYPDGGRLLVGLDGAQVPFEPTLHDDLGGRDLAELVDRHVPEELVVPVPRAAAPERPVKEQIARAARARADREVEEDGILRTTGAAVAGTGKAVLELGKLVLSLGKVAVVLVLVLVLLAAVGGTILSAALVLGEVGAWLDGDGTWRKLAVVVPAGLGSAGVSWLSYRAILRLGGEAKGDAEKND
jgi:zinc protease